MSSPKVCLIDLSKRVTVFLYSSKRFAIWFEIDWNRLVSSFINSSENWVIIFSVCTLNLVKPFLYSFIWVVTSFSWVTAISSTFFSNSIRLFFLSCAMSSVTFKEFVWRTSTISSKSFIHPSLFPANFSWYSSISSINVFWRIDSKAEIAVPNSCFERLIFVTYSDVISSTLVLYCPKMKFTLSKAFMIKSVKSFLYSSM